MKFATHASLVEKIDEIVWKWRNSDNCYPCYFSISYGCCILAVTKFVKKNCRATL